MQISSTHARSPARAYDITVTVKADGTERIKAVRVAVNGFAMDHEPIDAANCVTWVRTYSQQGDYPGTTKLVVTAPNSLDHAIDYVETWS